VSDDRLSNVSCWIWWWWWWWWVFLSWSSCHCCYTAATPQSSRSATS